MRNSPPACAFALALLSFLPAKAIAQLPPFVTSSTSPSGRHTLNLTLPTAVSDGGWAPFVYSITDTRSGKTTWTRSQGVRREKGFPTAFETEFAPLLLLVTDDAEPLGLMNTSEMFFANLSHPALSVRSPSIPSSFADARAREHDGRGWIFGAVSIMPARLPIAEGRSPVSCVIVRAPWGEQLVFNARTLRILAADNKAVPSTPESARVMRSAIQYERDSALAALAQAAAISPATLDAPARQKLSDALQSAGLLNLREAIPDLRRLEATCAAERFVVLPESLRRQLAALQAELEKEFDAGFLRGVPNDERLQQLSEQIRLLQPVPFIQPVHLALRRLGERPVAGVGVPVFSRPAPHAPKSREAQLNANLLTVQERLDGIPAIKAGMQIWSVFYTLGCPDERPTDSGQATVYLYHIDAPEPFTLRVTLRPDRLTVSSIEEIRPPLWKETAELRSVVARP